MSIACWVIVYSPQLYENYSLQSGEGLSIPFVLTWLIGDLANLFGAAMAGLLPTVIILAVYYTLCDMTLLAQIYYYRWRTHQTHSHSGYNALPTEASPLLSERAVEKPKWKKILLGRPMQYFLAVVFVVGTGFAASAIFRSRTAEDPQDPTDSDEIFEWKSQLLGWTSAVMYIGSRIPQIVKNAKTKCAGLSLALFVFCLGGNVTYVSSILVADPSKEHVIANLSWLCGSGLTIFLDLFVG